MLKMFSKKVSLEVNGLNLDRLFKQLKRKNIEMFNIKRKTYKKLCFDVNNNQLKQVKQLTEKYDVKVLKRYGIPFIKTFFKERLGMLIGLGITLIIVAILSQFIWNIEIYGNEEVTNDEVLTALSESGIVIGQTMDEEKIERAEDYLESRLNKVSFVSLVKKGSSIIVNIKEIRTPDIMDNVNATANLISNFDGVITSVNLIQGTLMVDVGDVVKKGDVLIKGSFTGLNQNITNCVAMGEVFAKVWYTESVNFLTEEVVQVRTGNTCETVNLSLFGTSSKVRDANVNFNNYEEEQTEEFLFKNNLIPIKINKTIYYETMPETITKNFDDYKQNLLTEALLKAKEKMPIEISALKEFTTINKNDNNYLIQAFIEAEVLITIME